MGRKTRRQMAGGKQEDAWRREAEEELRELEQELRRERWRNGLPDLPPAPIDEEDPEPEDDPETDDD